MEIFREAPTYSVGFCGDVCLFIPAGPPSKEEMDGLLSAITTLKRRLRKPVALFLFVPADAASPQGADYGAAKAGFQAVANDLAISTWIMEGTGFKAAAKRGLTAFLTSSLLGKVPTKVFGTTLEAAQWITKQAQEITLPPVSELLEDVRNLNERMLFRQKRPKGA